MSRLLLVAISFLLGCQSPPPAKEIDGQQVLAYARAQVDFGPRIPGTDGHRKTQVWLDSLLRARADSVVVQAWDYPDRNKISVPMKNFIGRFNLGAARRILFVAHWDTRPVADNDSGPKAKQPIPGANDGASGVAVLLGMADALKKSPPPPAIGVDLLFVDGEDYGDWSTRADVLVGSTYYAAHQPAGPTPGFAVLLDMVGGTAAQFPKEGNSVTGAPAVVDLVWALAARMGYSNHFTGETGGAVTDDHVPLQQAGIRAIDVIPQIPAGYPYWHTVDDTIDKLSAETLKAVGDVMMAVIRNGRIPE